MPTTIPYQIGGKPTTLRELLVELPYSLYQNEMEMLIDYDNLSPEEEVIILQWKMGVLTEE